MSDLLVSLGHRVRARRAVLKLSLAELARKGGFDEVWLARVESGREDETLVQTLPALADALQVSIDWLVRGRGTWGITPALHRFLMTPTGLWARQHGIVDALLQLPTTEPPTVELYRQFTNAVRAAYEEQQITEEQPVSDDLIDCPGRECGAPLNANDVGDGGVCRYCGQRSAKLAAFVNRNDDARAR